MFVIALEGYLSLIIDYVRERKVWEMERSFLDIVLILPYRHAFEGAHHVFLAQSLKQT